ncbi:sigma-70 family RNA polymerase sigma factor [Sediminibacillus dalangtanensis]|uniref:Sigma-70 family RNA polymerase sigma factor n=1 Tax=Sediminibacillus dalangtanensis TaxID=2729421 RepID=A0ABX7VQ45_9BACI|nr:RNA polymerase sigma factor [Sediminibacillus dalangtanensis]QTM99067.1 sigma-70 family RNA polymerase sigma factor [Sediminibacillus dalangtanensis]
MRPLVNQTPAETKETFTNAIEAHVPHLKNYCISLTSSKWDGEDLMQETLAKAYQSHRKETKPITKAYLYRIASNTWIDQYRKRKPDEDYNRELSSLPAEKAADSDFVLEAIETALRQLSPKQRVSLLLTEGFGYTALEAAELVGTSEGAIKAALHRGRANLKRRRNWQESDSDEETVAGYITAIHHANPQKVVELFKKETQEPTMAYRFSGLRAASFSVIPISAANTVYVVVTLSLPGGKMLAVPFYRKEWQSLLALITGEVSFAA